MVSCDTLKIYAINLKATKQRVTVNKPAKEKNWNHTKKINSKEGRKTGKEGQRTYQVNRKQTARCQTHTNHINNHNKHKCSTHPK